MIYILRQQIFSVHRCRFNNAVYLGEGYSQRWQSNQKRRHFPHTSSIRLANAQNYSLQFLYQYNLDYGYTKPNVP